MKFVQYLCFGVVNTLAVLITYFRVAGWLHSLTGQYLDQINLTSIASCVICLTVLLLVSRLEAKQLALNVFMLLVSSFVMTSLTIAGLVVVTDVIADRIG